MRTISILFHWMHVESLLFGACMLYVVYCVYLCVSVFVLAYSFTKILSEYGTEHELCD